MIIKLNIDFTSYHSKEEAQGNAAIIRSKLGRPEAIKETTPGKLAEFVEKGFTFTPSIMEGTTETGWKAQQVFCVDIDNSTDKTDANGKKTKVCIDAPLTVEEAKQYCNDANIKPCFIYYTFSNKADFPKFRLVFVSDAIITDLKEARETTQRLVNVFNSKKPGCADAKTIDGARLFFGGLPGCIADKQLAITSLESIKALPMPSESEEEEPKQEETSDLLGWNYKRETSINDKQVELQARFEYEKANFNLAEYIERTTSSTPRRRGNTLFFNPCPICGHNDDFSVDGAIYHCFSASDKGGTGGSIIDYLINKEGLTLAEACNKFNCEIMGHDRDEWKATTPTPSKQEESKEETGDEIEAFLQRSQGKEYKPLETGIKALDVALQGGFLRKTLITLYGAPGMGKTALAQWIFETMAKNGHSVLYFNIEMATDQLLARSISRICFEEYGADLNALQVLRGYERTPEEIEIIKKASQYYKDNIAPNYKSNPKETTNNIKSIYDYIVKETERKKAEGKQAPIICIDYLQLLKADGRDTAEEITNILMLLKDYAMQNNTIVFLISANNRESNKEGISTQESGRDTSALEYSGDLMLGLSYTAILDKREYRTGESKNGKPVTKLYDIARIREEKRKAFDAGADIPLSCQEISLTVLKNRFGDADRRARLIFDGKHTRFTESKQLYNGFNADEWKNAKEI